ncbi:MAG: hypothetical protein KDB01_23060 [Planctomycetaceae bacterium]|nr:hypothetical protein [Planctomycetaceae bacterium]
MLGASASPHFWAEEEIKKIGQPPDWESICIVTGGISLVAGIAFYAAWFECVLKPYRSLEDMPRAFRGIMHLGRLVFPDFFGDGTADRFFVPMIATVVTVILVAFALYRYGIYESRIPVLVREIDTLLKRIDESRKRMEDAEYRMKLQSLGVNVRGPRERLEPAHVQESVDKLHELRKQAEEKYASLQRKPASTNSSLTACH